MSAASLFADLSIVAGLTAAGAYLIWLMCQGRDDAVSEGTWQTPWGDVVEVHEEAKAAARKERAGGAAPSGQRPALKGDIAHREEASR